MHKNTFVLVTVLAVIAALLVGFNLGKKFNLVGNNATPTPSTQPTPTQKPLTDYTNSYCHVSLSYPSALTLTENATYSATFSDTNQNTVTLACQNEIPRIAIQEENIETMQIGTVAATLYHTASPKDGTPIDVLIFTHPTTTMDVLLSGMGTAFTTIINSLTLTP